MSSESDSATLGKVYCVALLGHTAVGKTSLIDQFESSDHADVYRGETDSQRNNTGTDVDLRSDKGTGITQLATVAVNK